MTTELATKTTMTELAQIADTAAAAGIFATHNKARSENTRRAQRADLVILADYLAAMMPDAPTAEELHSTPAAWAGISWGIVAGLIASMQRDGYAAGSIARAVATVKRFARLAFTAGCIDATQHALIATVTAPKARDASNVDAERAAAGLATRRTTKRAIATPITAEQRKALLAQPDTPQGRRDAVIMALLIEHGLRVSEVADLQVTGVDLAKGRLTFYRRKVDAWQTHAMTPASRAALVAWLPDAPAIGPLLRGSRKDGNLAGAGMTVAAIAARVNKLAAAAGVAARVSPHDLRHDWATSAADGGTDAFALRDAGGWRSLAMPSRYVAAAAVANERVKLAR